MTSAAHWLRRGWPLLYLAGVAAALMAGFAGWGYDDPYITYRYADNLRHGLGLVYNPDLRVLSTTSPLFALLLAGLAFLTADLPHLANLIGALSLPAGGLLMWSLGRRWQMPLVGWAGLLIFPFFPMLLVTLGSETPLYIALCLGTLASLAYSRFELAAGLAALATLTRADGALLLPLLVAALILHFRRDPAGWRSAGRAAIIYAALTLPWFIAAAIYYGSPVPVTLFVKQQQGTLPGSVHFLAGFVEQVAGMLRTWPNRILVALAVVGLVAALVRAHRLLWLLGWQALYFAGYAGLRVSRYFWYYAPLVPGLIATAGLGLEVLARRLIRSPVRALQAGVLVVAALAVSIAPSLVTLASAPDSRLAIYRAAGNWLHEMTPAGATVGTLEVGIIGYYAGRPMVDFAGLIQPDIARQLSPTSSYQASAAWAMHAYQPDYLVLNPTWFPELMPTVVQPHCALRTSLAGRDYGYDGQINVYSCSW